MFLLCSISCGGIFKSSFSIRPSGDTCGNPNYQYTSLMMYKDITESFDVVLRCLPCMDQPKEYYHVEILYLNSTSISNELFEEMQRKEAEAAAALAAAANSAAEDAFYACVDQNAVELSNYDKALKLYNMNLKSTSAPSVAMTTRYASSTSAAPPKNITTPLPPPAPYIPVNCTLLSAQVKIDFLTNASASLGLDDTEDEADTDGIELTGPVSNNEYYPNALFGIAHLLIISHR